MFAGPDPFAGVDTLMSQQLGGNLQETAPATQHTAPPPIALKRVTSVPVTSKRVSPVLLTSKHLAPQVAESSKMSGKRNASNSSSVLRMRIPKVTRPGDGWYVAHNAVSPGTYYGV